MRKNKSERNEKNSNVHCKHKESSKVEKIFKKWIIVNPIIETKYI